MAFLHTIPPADAEGPVREMYQQAQSRFGYVPNWAQAFSLRPGVRDGWAALLHSIQSNLSVRSYELATLAAARCFFSKLLDALGVQPDSSFNDLDPTLRRALTVGRPVDDLPAARLPEVASTAPRPPGVRSRSSRSRAST
jgi:hypothetical protein